MITIFNRAELIITRSMDTQAQVRGILGTAGIDYITKVNSGHSRGISSQRAHTGSFGQNPDVQYEYRIFVNKKDYEKAKYLIRSIM